MVGVYNFINPHHYIGLRWGHSSCHGHHRVEKMVHEVETQDYSYKYTADLASVEFENSFVEWSPLQSEVASLDI